MNLYHITFQNLGQAVMINPSVSADAHTSEISVARVCAAPSVAQCIDALAMCDKVKDGRKSCKLVGFIYQIEDVSQFKAYSDVFDFSETGEHISEKPAAATLVGIIHIPAINNAGYMNKEKTTVSPKGIAFEEITAEIFNQYYA